MYDNICLKLSNVFIRYIVSFITKKKLGLNPGENCDVLYISFFVHL